MTNQTIGIHVIHTDPVVSAGLKAMLCGAGEPALALHASLEEVATAVVIADYDRALRFCRELPDASSRERYRVLVVTHHDKEWDVRHAIRQGVHGYLPQNAVPDELLPAVQALAAGRRYLGNSVKRSISDSCRHNDLTERECDVLQLLGLGYCNKLIARELGIGVGTVKTHMKSLMTKLNVTARTPAVIVATQRGLLHLDAATPGVRGPGRRVRPDGIASAQASPIRSSTRVASV